MSHLLPDGKWTSVPLCAAVIWLITSICFSRRAASSSLSAVWVLSVRSREVAMGNNILLVGAVAFCLFLTPAEQQVPKSRTPTQQKAKAWKAGAGLAGYFGAGAWAFAFSQHIAVANFARACVSIHLLAARLLGCRVLWGRGGCTASPLQCSQRLEPPWELRRVQTGS